MRIAPPVAIDVECCTGCGLCVPVCPHEMLEVSEGRVHAVSDDCMGCGHCEAACPAGAIEAAMPDAEASRFSTFEAVGEWLGFGQPDTAQLVRLMRSRRSTRNFKDKPVSREMLEDLARIGATAPSGTNSQRWTFNIAPDRSAVMRVGDVVGAFFRRLNRMAERAWVREGLRLLGRRELHDYYHGHYASVCDAMARYAATGEDLLFHGAQAAIAVGSRPGASCPAEDALLATQNILLAAHSLGLGTCLVGYVVEAARRDAAIGRAFGMPEGEPVYSVIALGWPDEHWSRTAGRAMPVVRWADGGGA